MLKVVEKKKIWFSISAIIIAIGLIAMFTKGLNFGIDFEGGTNIILKFDEEYNKEDVDSIVKGFASDAVTNTAENNEYEIKSKNFESKDVSKLVEELKKKCTSFMRSSFLNSLIVVFSSITTISIPAISA